MMMDNERRPVGRPRKPPRQQYTEHIVVKFTPGQMEAVRALVEREGHCPIGTYVRQLLLARAAER